MDTKEGGHSGHGADVISLKEFRGVGKTITEANSFSELLRIIQTNEMTLSGTQSADGARYTTDELINLLEKVRRRELPATSAPRDQGFRKKLTELMGKEDPIFLREVLTQTMEQMDTMLTELRDDLPQHPLVRKLISKQQQLQRIIQTTETTKTDK